MSEWAHGAMPSDDIPPGEEPPPDWSARPPLPEGWEDEDKASSPSPVPLADRTDVNLARLAQDVAQLLDEFSAEGTIGQHDAAITFLTQTLEKLLKAPPKSKPSPFSWAHATGQTRAQLWQDLTEHVERHNARFGPADSALHLVGCWYQHPVVVEELTALMEAWRTAYLGHQAPTIDSISYLQNYFHPTMQRIHTAPWGLKGCIGGHRDPTLHTSPNTFDPAIYDRLVAADLATHPDTEPDPDPEGDE